LLGSYRNPATGNTLIGGINLNYCTDKEINQIRSALDKFAAGKSLYQRYHIGRQLFPQIFTNKYRTYKASEIQGLEKDVIYPTMGVLQRIGSFAKAAYNKLLGRKPTKQEIEDLDSIDPESYQEMQKTVQSPQEFNDKLDVAIDDIADNAQTPPEGEQEAQETEQAAADARLTAQMAQAQEEPTEPPPVETPEDAAVTPPEEIEPAMEVPEPIEVAEPIPELDETESFEEPEEPIEVEETAPEDEVLEIEPEPERKPVIDQKIDQALRGNMKGGNDFGVPRA